jgi:Cd2+/Zn2+-exporting ATPase
MCFGNIHACDNNMWNCPAARSGLLVRGGSHLESLAKVKVLAMDKTGTLTEGHFRVLDVHSIDKTTSLRQILYWWVVT